MRLDTVAIERDHCKEDHGHTQFCGRENRHISEDYPLAAKRCDSAAAGRWRQPHPLPKNVEGDAIVLLQLVQNGAIETIQVYQTPAEIADTANDCGGIRRYIALKRRQPLSRLCRLLAANFGERAHMPDEMSLFGPGTLAVWGGAFGPQPMNAAQPSIVQTAAFAYSDVATWRAVAQGEIQGDIYSRNTNPTVYLLEEKMRLLEGGEAAAAFASGMAAISNTLLALLRPGDRVVSLKDTYGATSRMFLEILPAFGIETVLVDAHDVDALRAAIRKGCGMVYVETPTNPMLKIVNLVELRALASAAGALLVVDSTIATPINQRPLALGADLVLHSATKFLSGHDDVLGGVLIGRADLVQRVFKYREITGAALSPFSAFLILRGLKTLQLRVERANATAQNIATFLASDPRIERVYYPGLADHPGHSIAREQMTAFGGILSIVLTGGDGPTERFVDALKLVSRAASFGSVNSLVGVPSTTSHVEVSKQDRVRLGIPEALVRYSCGVEDPCDLLRDLRQALVIAHE